MVTIKTGDNSIAFTVEDTSEVRGFGGNPGTKMFNKGSVRTEIINGSINFWDRGAETKILTVDYNTVDSEIDGTKLTDANVVDTLDQLFRSESFSGGNSGTVTVVDNLLSTSSTNALSANMGRALKEQIDAQEDHTNIIWVNGAYVPEDPNTYIPTGKDNAPYLDINSAVVAAPVSSLICVCSGSYDGDLDILDKHNISIAPAITIGNQPRVEVRGGLNIDEASYRIGIKGIEFDGSSQIDSSNGNIYLEQVNFNASCTFEGNGYVSARTCWFNGLSWTDGNVELNGCYNENQSLWALNGTTNSGKIFAARNCLYPIFNHRGGIVIGIDNYYAKTLDTNTSIYSSASGTGDAILITGGSTQQADGSYGTITKLGACTYSLGTLAIGNDASLTLSGTRIDSGLGGSQVFVNQPTPGYTRASAALRDHLLGISAKLVELTGVVQEGDISDTNESIEAKVGNTGLIVSVEYKSSTTSQVRIRAESGTVTPDICRVSVYNGASEGKASDGQPIDTTGILIDDTIYNASNDLGLINIAVGDAWYEAKVFCSGSGSRARIKVKPA